MKLMNFIENCNEDHMKTIRIRQREYEQIQLKESYEYYGRLKAIVTKWWIERKMDMDYNLPAATKYLGVSSN